MKIQISLSAITPQVIHKLADSLGISWDNDPDFLLLTKQVTGKAHLDELDSTELQQLHDVLLSNRPGRLETSPVGRHFAKKHLKFFLRHES